MKIAIAILIAAILIASGYYVKAQNLFESVQVVKASYKQFDWTSGDLDYLGENNNSSAADGDTDWIIYKYTWSGSNVTKIQKREGSWTNRASLPW